MLNPHRYPGTVLLVGSIGAQQPSVLRGWFVAGARTASLLWFGLVGLTLWVLTILLVRHPLAGY